MVILMSELVEVISNMTFLKQGIVLVQNVMCEREKFHDFSCRRYLCCNYWKWDWKQCNPNINIYN